MGKPAGEFGHVVKRQYCETCKPRAVEYLAELEKMRRDLVTRFNERRDELRGEFREGGFRLPDDNHVSR